MEEILNKLKNKKDLTFEESKSAFEILMTGKANEDQIYNFLTLLSEKGEVADEIAGGVYVLREKSKRVNVKDCILFRQDCSTTYASASGSFNITLSRCCSSHSKKGTSLIIPYLITSAIPAENSRSGRLSSVVVSISTLSG